MRKTLLCMTAISGVFTSCRNQQSTSVDIMPAQTVAEYFTQLLQHPLVIQEAANTDGLKHDAFDINGMRIHGDTLLVDVAFSGGCDQHEFTMSTNKQWLKSMPPQILLELTHDGHGDACREMFMGTLRFDLKTIRHPQSKSIQIILNNNTQEKITYSY